MATFATTNDILEYEPQIKDYGIQEYTAEHEKTYDDIIRLLDIKWFPTYERHDVSVLGGHRKLSPSRLDASQFKRAAVYHVLGYYIYPKLSTFDGEIDVFERKMNYYKDKFDEEFDLIIRVGVNYDIDSSGSFSDSEKQSFYNGRLIR